MERTDAVSRLHPGVILLFFVCAIGGTLLVAHPLFRLAALLAALCCHALFCRRERYAFLLKTALPVCLLAAVLNPLFNHQGVHIKMKAGMRLKLYLPTRRRRQST